MTETRFVEDLTLGSEVQIRKHRRKGYSELIRDRKGKITMYNRNVCLVDFGVMVKGIVTHDLELFASPNIFIFR